MFHYVLQKIILATNSSATSVQIKSNVPRKVYQLITRNYLAKMVPDIAKTNTVVEIKCAKTNWRSNVPEIKCAKINWRSNVPEINCSGDQMFRRSKIPEIKCSEDQMCQSDLEIKCAGDRKFRRSNVPEIKCAKVI